MTTYESKIKTISSNEEVVFGILSDLNNIEKYRAKNPLVNNLKGLTFDSDSFSFMVDMVGEIGFRVVEREPFKTIKLHSEHSPVDMTVWIQIKQVAEDDTRLKITLKADLPAMIKMMVDKKLQEGIELVADALAVGLSQ